MKSSLVGTAPRFETSIGASPARSRASTIARVSLSKKDAITGNQLRIEDQLIYVATQNIGEQIKRSEAAWNTIKDVKELVELLLKPSPLRARGVHIAQPVLVRAGPGTGKTWMVKQAAYTLAKRLGGASARRPEGMQLVPMLVYVQRIVRLVREQGEEAEIIGELLRTRAMLPWYIENTFEGETRAMLLQAYELRALIVLIGTTARPRIRLFGRRSAERPALDFGRRSAERPALDSRMWKTASTRRRA